MMDDPNALDNAKDGVDYVHINERIVFENGETERTIEIEILNPNTPEEKPKEAPPNDGEIKEGEDQEQEEVNLMFKVRIEEAEPTSVKISKKNVCFVTIQEDEGGSAQEQQAKLVKYFMSERD